MLICIKILAARPHALWTTFTCYLTAGQLTPTSLGRYLPGDAKVKHKIKRVDRFLSNPGVHQDIPSFYQGITARLLQGCQHVFIAVDWSGCCGHDFHVLRASLLLDGRSLPLLNVVVSEQVSNSM